MNTQLLQVETDDRWLLNGMLTFPQLRPVKPNQADAWLLVHGTGGNFYSRGVLADFAQALLEQGHTVARINTRGHDYIAGHAPPPGRGFGGAAFESLSDCRRDITAWVDELLRHGARRIGLVGHSLGGVKAIYSQAHSPHPNVVAVIGISPPRFCYANWQTSVKAQPFRDSFQLASELVSQGRGSDLILVQQPLPMWLTAAGFLAKYGPHDDFDIVRLLPKVSVPTLVILGTESVARSPAFNSTPDAIASLTAAGHRVEMQLVPGADVNYSGQTDVPPTLAMGWLEQLERSRQSV